MLSSLVSLRQAQQQQHTPVAQTDSVSPSALYCKGCERFFPPAVYASHVGISRQLASSADEVSRLADVARRRFGLVLTAPLVTGSAAGLGGGLVYIPVHPACGSSATATTTLPGASGTVLSKEIANTSVAAASPLDLRTGGGGTNTPQKISRPPSTQGLLVGGQEEGEST